MRTPLAAALAAVLAIGALTGCGSDDNAGSSSSGSSSSANAPKGDPIKLGTIGSYTGAQAAALGKSSDVVEAWAKSVNDAGGINGHPVKLFVEDDAGNPAQGLQAANKLVEQDKVMAIVGTASLVDSAWQKYIDDKGIPVVGVLPPVTTAFTDPNFFPAGGNTPVEIFIQVQAAKEAGNKHYGTLYCAESPICASIGPLTEAAAGIIGGIEVSSGKVSVTAPNYTAPCLQMKNDGVDALHIGLNGEATVRVIQGCSQQGYEPTVYQGSNNVGTQFTKTPGTDGAEVTSALAWFTDVSNPAVKEMTDALNKYAPGLVGSPQYNGVGVSPWAGGKLFEAAAKAAKLSPTSTPDDVRK